MWRDFNKYWLIIVLVGVFFPSVAQQTEGLIYNLKQNWVQYDLKAESFMPASSQSSGNTINFQVDGLLNKHHFLYIKNKNKAYLFNNNVLMTELKHYY